ncbi:ARM repeat-containing protein [Saccharata proteae CBS 121410]|uniref:ARM repeat-containing protein n=1 Tax=Saccharata proteae CBS 121410 TaxID=1314787 RepID=A0A6A5YCQ6_9PEZI|nr:ARM repeat-containing protein [Saccharata proteae CBS 121410]
MFTQALKSFTSNINSNYSVASTPASTSGPWKIYDAKKKSTGKAASVFVFEKKSLEPQSGASLGGRTNAASLKRAQEEVLERLRKEAKSLSRLRHPSILELAEPVEETRNGGLMFATEPVTASLAGLLQDKDEQERAGGVGGRGSRYVVEEAEGKGRRRRDIEIDELEIQKGLLQIGKGLEFLHESAGLIHGNLTPDAIFVNAKSDWKISGLGFSSPPDNSTTATSVTPISLSEVLNYDPRLPRSVQLNLDYTSPDFVLDTNISSAADMFSLGLLIIALYNSPHRSPLETNSSLSGYKRIFSSSSSVPTTSNNFLSSSPLPRPLTADLLPRLITRRPAQRLNAREFQQAQYFDNILVSTIRFLDSLPGKTPNEKSQFMRGLPRILTQFPKSVLEKKVLPALLEEMKDKDLLALVLQNIFKIINMMPSSRRAFCDRVIPRLREIFLNSNKGATQERDSLKEAGLMVVLENMSTISDNTTGKEFKDDILPIILLALESPTHSIVDAALRTLPVILYVLDFSTIKNELFPIVANVFAKTNSMGIKIRGLQAFQTLCGGSSVLDANKVPAGDGLDGIAPAKEEKRKQNSAVLDKYTIQEKVVPLLKAIKTKEPAVMMAALEVFREVGKIADSDYLAMDVLPILWHFCLGPLLNLSQFQAYMSLIKSLSTRIEQEQTRKLQELSASNSTVSARADDFMSFGGVGASNGIDSGNGDDDAFQNLVLGRSIPAGGPSSDMMMGNGWATSSSNANVATTFSWSTPPPPPTTAPRPGLAPQNTGSRAITPDNTLSSFASLQPSTNTISTTAPSFSQPLQPTRPGIGVLTPTPASSMSTMSMNAMTPRASSQTTSGTSIDWSAATQPAASTHAWGTNMHMQSQQRAPSMSSLTTAPTPSFAIKPPPGPSQTGTGGSFGGFGIAPPPGMGQGMGGPVGQNGTGSAKQGMDKYESLL